MDERTRRRRHLSATIIRIIHRIRGFRHRVWIDTGTIYREQFIRHVNQFTEIRCQHAKAKGYVDDKGHSMHSHTTKIKEYELLNDFISTSTKEEVVVTIGREAVKVCIETSNVLCRLSLRHWMVVTRQQRRRQSLLWNGEVSKWGWTSSQINDSVNKAWLCQSR